MVNVLNALAMYDNPFKHGTFNERQWDGMAPLVWHNVTGRRTLTGYSMVNQKEVDAIHKLVVDLRTKLPMASILVMSAYKAQVFALIDVSV